MMAVRGPAGHPEKYFRAFGVAADRDRLPARRLASSPSRRLEWVSRYTVMYDRAVCERHPAAGRLPDHCQRGSTRPASTGGQHHQCRRTVTPGHRSRVNVISKSTATTLSRCWSSSSATTAPPWLRRFPDTESGKTGQLTRWRNGRLLRVHGVFHRLCPADKLSSWSR